MIAAILFGVAIAAAADDVEQRCAGLRALVGEPASVVGLSQGATLLAGPLGERVAAEAGRTSVEQAWALLQTATTLRCGDDRPDTAPVDLKALATDPRFSGVRNDDDVGDQLLDRVLAWFETLLESDAMLAFSEQTRTVYLTGLAIVGVVVAWRLRRRRLPVTSDAVVVGAGVERRRVQVFSTLRADAVAVLARDARAAMVLLRQALLARIGEVDVDAARPSRTASEVLARVSSSTAAAVAPALLHFDARFYAGLVDVDAATELLRLVDAGATALEARR